MFCMCGMIADFYLLQLEKEVRELKKQRDLAESRIEDLLRMVGEGQRSRQRVCTLILMFLDEI